MAKLDVQTADRARVLTDYSRWVWLIGTAISVIGAVAGWLLSQDPGVVILLVVTVVQTALAIPAALMLKRRANWARRVLLVLALLSLAAIYQAYAAQAWPSLVLNIALASTYFTLRDPSVKAHFQSATRPHGRRRLRGGATDDESA